MPTADPAFEMAERTHADCVAFALSPAADGMPFAGCEDLNTMCAVAHEVLRRRLAREGIGSVLVAGCYEGDELGIENHIWLRLDDGRLLDIAAEQFGDVPAAHPDGVAGHLTCVLLSGMHAGRPGTPGFASHDPWYEARDPSGLSDWWRQALGQFPDGATVSAVDSVSGSPVPVQCRQRGGHAQ